MKKDLFQITCLFIALLSFSIAGIGLTVFYRSISFPIRGDVPSVTACIQKAIAETEAIKSIFPDLQYYIAVGKGNPVYGFQNHCEPLYIKDGENMYFQFDPGLNNYELIPEKYMLAQAFGGPVRIYEYDVFKRIAADHPGMNPIDLAVFEAVNTPGYPQSAP